VCVLCVCVHMWVCVCAAGELRVCQCVCMWTSVCACERGSVSMSVSVCASFNRAKHVLMPWVDDHVWPPTV